MMDKKLIWSVVLIIDLLVFLLALISGMLLLNVLVIGVSLLIYKFGSPILFEAFDTRRHKKIMESQVIRQTVNEVIQSKHLVKKFDTRQAGSKVTLENRRKK